MTRATARIAIASIVLLAGLHGPRAYAWTINGFESAITIEQNGDVIVAETIKTDFGDEEKHGIFRTLPVRYKGESGYVYAAISDIAVRQDGSQVAPDITRTGNDLTIKIGDPDRVVRGPHEYSITYRVTGVLRDFTAYDELYWNVTGNDWEVPITHATASLTLPADIVQFACYKGPRLSAEPCDATTQDGRKIVFSANDLARTEGLTIAVGFTHGAVPIITVEPPPSILDVLASPISLAIAAMTAIAGLWLIIRIWWRHGRDRFWKRALLPGVRSDRAGDARETTLPLWFTAPVTVEYDPPDDLRPAEMGVLMDERADTLDVSATIIDLASRGYLEITEVPKKWLFGKTDYEFRRTAKPTDKLLAYESLLVKHLFEDSENVTMSELKNTFYAKLKEVKSALYKEVVNKKLFAADPSRIRIIYAIAGIALALMGILGVAAVQGMISEASKVATLHAVLLGLSLGIGFTGVMSLVASPFMPRKTAYGRELYQRSLGYRLFVSGTEKYRARFYEDKNMFVSVLPYAITFGVTGKLAKAFNDMGVTPPAPGWYHSPGTFNAAVFAAHMHDFSASLGSAMAAAPSGSGSGGGGFSGGGFGGGGGGSW